MVRARRERRYNMIIYLKDGTIIKYENDSNIIADLNGIENYINIKKVIPYKRSYFTIMTIPKESLHFIDWDNNEEAGVDKQILFADTESRMTERERWLKEQAEDKEICKHCERDCHMCGIRNKEGEYDG